MPGAFVEEVGGGLCGVEPDGGIATDPVGDYWGVELERELFKVDPWFVGGKLEGAAHDGRWEGTGRQLAAEEENACVVDGDGEDDERQEKESMPHGETGEGI